MSTCEQVAITLVPLIGEDDPPMAAGWSLRIWLPTETAGEEPLRPGNMTRDGDHGDV